MSYFDFLFFVNHMSIAVCQGLIPTAAPAAPSKLLTTSSRPQCNYFRPMAREEASHHVVSLDLVRANARRR